ncbi:MAG: hypothetical protein K9J42_06990 [Sulfuritalea sp.]|nr:hypothetical protein [Sulfuritalea sp.]
MIIDPKHGSSIVAMDAKHAKWIQIIEEIKVVGSEHLLGHSGIDAAERALKILPEYARIHFAGETECIAKQDYPALEADRKQHHELVTEISTLLSQIRTHASLSAPLKLSLLLTVRLLENIMQDDGKYAQFILGKSVLPNPAEGA